MGQPVFLVAPKMVEIRLDALEEANVPQDIFLSVRIGETQKLSKLSSSRTYKFPTVEGRRFGKIEVFRRIGTCNVDVDPINNDPHNVDIRCGADSLGVLKLSVAVEEQVGTVKKVPEPKKEGKMKAAKDYLQKHGLETQLSEAMHAVLRERPDAPAEFLAHRLLAAAGKTADVPPNQPKTGGEVVKVVAPPPPILPFKAYYGATFPILDQNDQKVFEQCYAKFPRKQAAAGKTTVTAPNQPKTGREVVKVDAPPPPILPFKAYYGAVFLPLDLSQCHAKFPRKQAKPITAAPVPTVNAQDMPVHMLPSVGTWTNRIPRRVRQLTASERAAPALILEKPAPAPIPVHLKPSVGTWLNRLPPKIEKLPEKKKFQLKPSVGTWLATIPPVEEPEPNVTGVLLNMQSRVGPAFASLGLPNIPFML